MRHQAKPFAVELKKAKRSKSEGHKESKGWADAYLATNDSPAQRSVDALFSRAVEPTGVAVAPSSRPVAARILPDLSTPVPAPASPEKARRKPTDRPREKKVHSPLPSERPEDGLSAPPRSPRAKSISGAATKTPAPLPTPIKQTTARSESSEKQTRQPRQASRWRTAGALHPGENWKRRLPSACR